MAETASRIDDMPQRCGFIAIIGAPNAGKSTLMNRLVGVKISIVTPKVQTTRSRILGVARFDEIQMVYVDTPGIFVPKRRLERAMVAAAWTGADDADEVVVLIDSEQGRGRDVERIVDAFKQSGRKVILALNKVDLVRREKLLDLAARFDADDVFSHTFMISALTGDGVEDLHNELATRMPGGPWLLPDDHLSEMNDRLFAAEITREKLFLQLRQELPYALTVETEAWQPFEDGAVRIEQTIYVERDSQKAIVLGKRGARIKSVREAAGAELAENFDRPVHLFIFVKVRNKWGDDPERYRDLGLDFNA